MAAQNPHARPITDADDEILVPRNLHLAIKKNNHHLNTGKFQCDDPIIVEILKNHPLRYALIETADIPVIYLQHLLHTLTIVKVGQEDALEDALQGRIDNTFITITLDRFRGVLDLPTANAKPHRISYDSDISEAQLLSEIRALGYAKELPRVSAFTRKYLPSGKSSPGRQKQIRAHTSAGGQSGQYCVVVRRGVTSYQMCIHLFELVGIALDFCVPKKMIRSHFRTSD